MAKKISIIRCNVQSESCAGFHCLPAFSKKTGPFQQYDTIELVGFDTCGGCGQGKSAKIVSKAQRLKDKGAEVIHIGNCIIKSCPYMELYVKDIKENVNIDVVRGTH
jgi:predicted metal-binding protein